MRTVAFEDMYGEELLGPGDLIRPWEDDSASASMPCRTSWHAITPTALAALDGRFAALACRWPPVVARLMANAVERSQSRSVHLAIAQARRAEVRLLLLFWHLADRFGRVGAEGVVVPVPLTHERLAGLVCLRRPTVSVALQQLRRCEQVVRRPDGSWLLPNDPPDVQALLRGDDKLLSRAA
jgi:CRP-like cAMP-binding protein